MSKWSFNNEPKYITHSANSRTTQSGTEPTVAANSSENSGTHYVNTQDDLRNHPAPQTPAESVDSDESFHYVGTVPNDQRFGVDGSLPQQGMSGQGPQNFALADGKPRAADYVPFANSTQRESGNNIFGTIFGFIVVAIILLIAGSMVFGMTADRDTYTRTWNNLPVPGDSIDWPEDLDPNNTNWSVDENGHITFEEDSWGNGFNEEKLFEDEDSIVWGN